MALVGAMFIVLGFWFIVGKAFLSGIKSFFNIKSKSKSSYWLGFLLIVIGVFMAVVAKG